MTLPRSLPRPIKVFAIALLASLLWGSIEFGEPLDDLLKSASEAVRSRSSDGSIVVVAVDDRTYAGLGSETYSRTHDADLVNKLFALGARTVSFDKLYSSPTDQQGDHAFALALARHRGSVYLGRYQSDDIGKTTSEIGPIPELARAAGTRYLNGNVGALGLSTSFPFAADMPGAVQPIAVALSRTNYPGTSYYRPDYSIRVPSIPTVSMIDVLNGNIPATLLKNRDVIVGPTAVKIHDFHLIPHQGYYPGVYFHVISAQTLKEHQPRRLGWVPFKIIAIAAAIAVLRLRTLKGIKIAGVICVPSTLLIEVASQVLGYDLDITAGYVLLIPVLWSAWSYRAQQDRKRTNLLSGLPTIDVLKHAKLPGTCTILCAKVANYETICANLDDAADEYLFSQLSRRIKIESDDVRVFHHHDSLLWYRPVHEGEDLDMHIAGLKRILGLPVAVGNEPIDIAIAIGADQSHDVAWHRRVGLALNASVTAAQSGAGTFVNEQAFIEDSKWGLGIVSELERSIDNGEIYLEYQPKLEIATSQIIAAEALARWKHPTRGFISPAMFIEAAEKANRIEKLTQFVISSAIHTSKTLIEAVPDFQIAINISARALRSPNLLGYALQALEDIGAKPANLIFEITETSTLDTDQQTLAALLAFQAAGITISIDDYGSGNTNISYLTTIPASEVKIDMSFVQDIDTHLEHRIIVESTIALAHRLGWRVVAEGVETGAVLSILEAMECDIIQGYLIGKPMPMSTLTALVHAKNAPKHRLYRHC